MKGTLFLSFALTIAMAFHHGISVSRRDSEYNVEYNFKVFPPSAHRGLSMP